MSDLQIDICEAIEKVLCEKLDMPSCEGTYEIAVDIFNAVIEVMAISGATEFSELTNKLTPNEIRRIMGLEPVTEMVDIFTKQED